MSRGQHNAPWERRIEVADSMGKTHECCVDGCATVTLAGLLACRDHWLRLPKNARYVLREAFRRHDSHPDIYVEAVVLARRLLNEHAAA